MTYDIEKIKRDTQAIWEATQPWCVSMYLGGSLVDGCISDPHDIDIIFFSEKACDKIRISRLIRDYLRKKGITGNSKEGEYDYMQVRCIEFEENAYGSYINKMMVKIRGRDIDFSFDVIGDDRGLYRLIAAQAIGRIESGRINPKRLYQVVRGLYVMENGSYELTKEQAADVQALHDCDAEAYARLLPWAKETVAHG